jgi:hypothetical protein
MTGALRLPAVPERWPGLGRTIAPSCALLRIPAERLLDALKGLLLHVRSVVVGWRGARRALQNFVSDTLSTPPRRPASARASRSASEKRRPAEARGHEGGGRAKQRGDLVVREELPIDPARVHLTAPLDGWAGTWRVLRDNPISSGKGSRGSRR